MSVCVNDRDGDGNCPACARNPEAACRVSARDGVMRLRTEIHAAVGNECQIQHWLDEFEKAVAHELAEKIRNSKKLRDYTDDHMGDCNMAADLIDPEVSTDG